MSLTFEAIILLELGDREGIGALNKALYEADPERHQQFAPINMDGAGGTKWWTMDVYAACFNYLSPETVEECVRTTAWVYPDAVLYIQDLGDYERGDEGEPALTARKVSDIRKEQP